MPERSWRILLVVAWGYTLLCCALVPVTAAVFWVYHPAVISEKLLGYFGSDNQLNKAAQFELTKIYIQTTITFLTTMFFAAGAYIIVTHSQKTSARLQLAMAKLKLVSELDAEIRGVFNKSAIYDPADGKAPASPRNFVFGLDRRTTWKANCRPEWHHHFGERTTLFVETSTVLAPNSEVSINVLHDYVAWVRRVRVGVDFGILDWPDVQLYWRNFVSLASGSRFSFMCDVFSREDMSDFAFLVNGLILFEDKARRGNLLRYIDHSTHRALLDALSPEARAIVAPPVSGRTKARAQSVQNSAKWNPYEEQVSHMLITKALRARREPRWRNVHLFGAPWQNKGKLKFVDDLRERFSKNPEEAFKYVDVVTDRIISKGVGLLQFNAVLSVLLVWAFEHYGQSALEHWFVVASLVFSAVSSLMMIALMYTVWRKTGYADAYFDLDGQHDYVCGAAS